MIEKASSKNQYSKFPNEGYSVRFTLRNPSGLLNLLYISSTWLSLYNIDFCTSFNYSRIVYKHI